MTKFPIKSQSAYLNRILNEHMSSAAGLNDHLMSLGVRVDFNLGIRESFVKSIEICTGFFGQNSAIEVLMSREIKGQENYQAVLEMEDLSGALKEKIENDLLPKINQHLTLLQTLESEAVLDDGVKRIRAAN